jgi:tetratricopeptide (TPR) repeat protein
LLLLGRGGIIQELKRNRQLPQAGTRASDQNPNPEQPVSQSPQALTPTRRWLFRGIIVLVIPLLLLSLLEGVLVLFDFGHPTTFFLHREIAGKKMLVDNPWFGLRFFPPALARSPSPVSIPAEKPPGVFRIFLFGESAAMGDPRPAYGMGRFLEALLGDRFPGLKFEVVCVAMTAINSHAVLPIARECARYQGDLWIIYMGNNEFAGPFGANTVFGPQAPPATTVRAFLALESTRIGQLLVNIARSMHVSRATPASWGGLKMFLDHQLPPNDPRRERVYQNFQRNLDDIIATATRAGVRVILTSVASNLKDCPPFGSYCPSNSASPHQIELQQLSNLAATNAAQRNFSQAIDACRKALELNPDSAELHFQLGECFLGATNFESALQSFHCARDLDTLPFRADTRINQIIAVTAKRQAGRGVSYVDSEGVLALLNQSHITGSEAFYEHVHLNWDGNYRLALALAQQTVLSLPRAVAAGQRPAWADPAACAHRLGLTGWNRYTILEEILRRLADPPFTDQLNHDAQLQQITNALAEIRARARPSDVPAARTLFETELRQHPDDQWLHHNFAEFLTNTGDLPEATRQMQAVCELLPDNQAAYFQLGRLLARQKKYDQAQAALETAVRLRPELSNARVELGQVLVAQKKLDDALAQYAVAQRGYGVDSPRLHLLQADVLARQNKHDAAIDNLRQAVQLRQDYWEAHELLGMELALETNYPQAQVQFEQVVSLRPSYAVGHLNLGIAFAREHQVREAIDEFQTTLRLDPNNSQAQTFLSALKELQPASP